MRALFTINEEPHGGAWPSCGVFVLPRPLPRGSFPTVSTDTAVIHDGHPGNELKAPSAVDEQGKHG